MISIFKKKQYLRDLIPTNYVDIHSHVLPGIDDGAKTIENTQFLLENMIDFGFTKKMMIDTDIFARAGGTLPEQDKT